MKAPDSTGRARVVHGRKAPTSTGRDLLGDRAAQEPPEGMATRASTGRAPEVRGRVGSMGPRGRDPEVRDRKAPTSTGHGRSNGQRANDLLGLEVRAAQAGSAPPARRLASVWAIRGLEVRVLEGHGLEGRGRAVPGRVGLGRVLTPARPGVRTASRALPGASGAPMSRRHAGRAQLEPARGHGLAKTRGRALKASCNTYFITNGLHVAGISNIVRLGQRFHLGERTGLPTRQEVSGIFLGQKKMLTIPAIDSFIADGGRDDGQASRE